MKILSLFDGKYEVCSDGTVWSNVGKRKQMIGKTTRTGYRMIVFTIDGKKQYPLVHRLVAQAFIPNPENKPEVNHKNGIKTDNRVENLEWCSYSENNKHAYQVLKRNNPKSKKIVQMLNGFVIQDFCSSLEAERQTGISASAIRHAICGKSKTAGGYIWKHKEQNYA